MGVVFDASQSDDSRSSPASQPHGVTLQQAKPSGGCLRSKATFTSTDMAGDSPQPSDSPSCSASQPHGVSPQQATPPGGCSHSTADFANTDAYLIKEDETAPVTPEPASTGGGREVLMAYVFRINAEVDARWQRTLQKIVWRLAQTACFVVLLLAVYLFVRNLVLLNHYTGMERMHKEEEIREAQAWTKTWAYALGRERPQSQRNHLMLHA